MDRPSLTYNSDFLEMIDYPLREELSFISCPLDQFKEPYETLLDAREKNMKDKFIELMISNQ